MPVDATIPPEQRIVRFHGSRGVVAELTWGQRSIWDLHHMYSPEHHYFNFGRLLVPPDGTSVPAVVRSLRRLVEIYEAFRTTVHLSTDGRPRQHVAESGEFPLPVHEAGDDAAAAADELIFEYKGHPFRDDEWPLRVGVVTRRGSPAYILFMASHLAVDRWGMENACAAFLRLLTNNASPVDPARDAGVAEAALRQPADQAAVEASPSGQRMAERSVQYWRRTLVTIPHTMFPFRPAADQARLSPAGELTSSAVALAADALADEFGGSASGVILAATAGLIGIRTGNTTVALRLFASNRYGSQAQAMVATCVQPALFSVDLRDVTFRELIARSWQASVLAYRHARYPSHVIDRLIDEVTIERGAMIDLLSHFHDMTDVGPPADHSPDAGEVLAALPDSRFRHRGVLGVREKFLLKIGGQRGGRLRLSLVADPRYLSRDDVRTLVCGIETLLVEAVQRDFSLAEAAELAGVVPRRRSRTAIVVGGCRTEPEAVLGLLRDIPGVVAAQVSLADGPGGPLLIGRVAVDRTGVDAESLHLECVRGLQSCPMAITPDYYFIHLAQVADGDSDLEEVLSDLPLCAEGDGRPSRRARPLAEAT
jgi:Condensation domain